MASIADPAVDRAVRIALAERAFGIALWRVASARSSPPWTLTLLALLTLLSLLAFLALTGLSGSARDAASSSLKELFQLLAQRLLVLAHSLKACRSPRWPCCLAGLAGLLTRCPR